MTYNSTVVEATCSRYVTRTASHGLRLQVRRGLKNASWLAIGNLVSQAVAFLGFAFIARLLGPNGYGVYVTVGAFVGMFDIFLLRGLDKVIVRQGSRDLTSMDRALERTVAVRNALVLIAIGACMIGCLFAPYKVQTKLYIVLFSLNLIHGGLNGFFGTIYQASQKMQYMAILGIANRVLCVGASIAYLYLGGGLLGLFMILLVSNLAMLLVTYRCAQRIVPFRFFSHLQFDVNLLRPALIFSLVSFIGFFVLRIDVLMISFLGDAKDVGVYGVAQKICSQGEMLRNVCAMAFFPIFVKRFRRQAVRTDTLIKQGAIFLIGVFALSTVISFVVEDMVVLVFGPRYEASGRILRVLIFYLASSWASLPFTSALQATHNEGYIIVPVVISAGLNVILNYVLFRRYGLVGIAYSTLVVTAVGCVVYWITALRVLRRQKFLV